MINTTLTCISEERREEAINRLLRPAERRADVELWGVPIAGRVAGYGWLAGTADAQESGAVVLDNALQDKLDRRMVRVVNAALDRQADTVTVRVVVPILGEQELVLARTAAPQA